MKYDLTVAGSQSLVDLIDDASAALYAARSAAELIDAFDLAKNAYSQAKRVSQMAKARKASQDLIHAAYRAQADALKIVKEAQQRLADEYDGAQERGEVAHGGERNDLIAEENKVPTIADIGDGLTSHAIFQAREIRDAEKADPGVIDRALDQAVAEGREPTSRLMRKVAREVAGRVAINKPKTDLDREIATRKFYSFLHHLKEQWSKMPVPVRRQFLFDIGLKQHRELVESVIRADFKPKRWIKAGSIDYTLPPMTMKLLKKDGQAN